MDRGVAARRAAALLAVEGVALALLGVVDGVLTVTGSPENRGAAVGVAVVAVLFGLLLVALARGVDRRRSWPRTPAVLLQLLAFPVGTDQVRGGAWPIGVVVLLLAGATLYHLVAAGRPD